MQEKHVLVTGSSGGGKTTYLRMILDRHDGPAVWVDYGGESTLEAGQTVRSFEDMARLVRRCPTTAHVRNLRMNFVAEGSDPKDLEAVKRFGKMVGQHFDGEVCTLVVADEAAPLLPDDEDASSRENNPLAWLLHEGRDRNVKVVLCTQDPSELYYPPVKNLKWLVWVGKSKTFTRSFKQQWGFHDVDLPSENHRYVVMDPLDPPVAVFEGATDPEPIR